MKIINIFYPQDYIRVVDRLGCYSDPRMDPSLDDPAKTIKTLPPPVDGVFSNTAAKPEAPPKYVAANEELPSYHQVSADAPDGEGSQEEDSFPGSYSTFLASLSVVCFLGVHIAFGVMLFLSLTLISSSHAMKLGARAGFGFVLINSGITSWLLPRKQLSRSVEEEPGAPAAEDGLGASTLLCGFIVVVGFVLVCSSTYTFVKLKRCKGRESPYPAVP